MTEREAALAEALYGALPAADNRESAIHVLATALQAARQAGREEATVDCLTTARDTTAQYRMDSHEWFVSHNTIDALVKLQEKLRRRRAVEK